MFLKHLFRHYERRHRHPVRPFLVDHDRRLDHGRAGVRFRLNARWRNPGFVDEGDLFAARCS